MKVSVDKNLCIGCGACAACCSDVFEFGDDGLAESKVDIVPEELEEDVQDALEGCPTSAISKVNE